MPLKTTKPFDNCYWLSSDQILAGEVPVASNQHYTDLKIVSLFDAGIRVFIDLRKERNLEYEDVLKQVAQKKGVDIEYFRYPIPDMGAPSVSVVREILDLIDESVKNGKPVYYHCLMGLGRTGLISGCWLAKNEQIEGSEILKLLWEIRMAQDHLIHYDSPQTNQQKQMVLDWE